MKTNFARRFWFNCAIIVGSVIFGALGITFLSSNFHANASAIVNDRATAQAQNTAIGHFADLQHDAPIATSYMTAYATLIPDQYQLINFQNWLDASGKVFGVAANFSFQGNLPSVAPGSIGTAPISLNVQGPFQNVIAFLAHLEGKASGFIVRIDSYNISQDSAGNTSFVGQGALFFH